jgi:transmembrane sensor
MDMDARPDDQLREDARLWAIRVGGPAFADWDSFVAWLEADPRHSRAYDAAVDEQADADALFDVPPAPAFVQPARRAGPRWRMPAIAASVAVLAGIGGWYALDQAPLTRTYTTAPGERRTIALADGSRILLNGGTQLSMDASRPRAIAMARGEAVFEVRHDAADPFVITTPGGARLIDVGTVFNVEVEGGALDVGVSEGGVVYRDGADEVRLNAGEGLTRRTADAAPVKHAVAPETVGAWRGGSLEYTDAPLGDVATDLSRNLGVPVGIDAALAARRFSGTIMLDGGSEAVMARVGPLLDVRLERRGNNGWMITTSHGARP